MSSGVTESMAHEVMHMTEMGLLVSVVPPLFILLTRRRLRYRGLSWPAAAALPFFLSVHAAIVILMSRWEPPLLVHGLLHIALVTGGVVFWLPVLGYRRRLSGPLRCVYLFVACPALDLPAVWVVGWGDSSGGLAMIVAMLPIGVIAVYLTWKWISGEEQAVRAAQQQELAEATDS